MKKMILTTITGLLGVVFSVPLTATPEITQESVQEKEMLAALVQDYGGSQLPTYNMQVSVDENAIATVYYPQLCVTDKEGANLKSSLVGGIVELMDYRVAPVGGFPKGTVLEDGSVSISFPVSRKGASIRVVDPTFANGKLTGWVCPSDNPADQVKQMHGGHIVTVLAFMDGRQVILTPQLKAEMCRMMPHPEDASKDDASSCDAVNQPH